MILNFAGRGAVALGLLVGLPAAAGHPLATDDVGTQGHGGLELEASAVAAPHANAGLSEVGIGLSLHAGLGPRIDIGLSALYVGSHADTGWHTRMGDPTFDFKWRFLDVTESVAVALRLDYRAPQASEFGSTGHDLGAALVGSWSRGALEIHVNGGSRRAAVGTSAAAWAIALGGAVGWALRPDVRAFAECVTEWAPGNGGWTAVQGAVQWQAAPAVVVSTGAGPVWTGEPGAAAEWRLAVGLTLTNG